MTKPKSFCGSLSSVGLCGQATCKKSHDLNIICYECKTFLPPTVDRATHERTAPHLKAINWLAEHPVCPICEVIVSAQVWSQHASSRSHKSRENATGQDPKGPVTRRWVPSGTVASCEVCRKPYGSSRVYQRHCKSTKHLQQLKVAAAISRLKELGESKNGVAVDAIVEFGPTDPTRHTHQILPITAVKNGVHLIAAEIPGSARSVP